MIKRFFRNTGRHIRESWKNSWRNKGLTFSSISAITVTLLVTGFFLLMVANINNIIELVKSDVTILVELVDDSTTRRDELIMEFQEFDNVRTVELSTKESELSLMIEAYSDYKDVFERYKTLVTLPTDVYFIHLNDETRIDEFLVFVDSLNGIGKVYHDGVVLMEVNANLSDESKTNLQQEIQNNELVDELVLTFKDEEIDAIKQLHPMFDSVLTTYQNENNPLHDVLLVKVKDVSYISLTAQKIESYEEVGNVQYGAGLVEKMVSIFTILQQVGLVIIVALFLVTAFLISNTIKITIYSRQAEIEIMRLVGATNRFIRMPFILEGAIIGLFGAILPVAISVFGYIKLYTIYNASEGSLISPFIKLVPPFPLLYYVIIFLVTVSLLVGLVGSTRAVSKFLRKAK